MGYRSMSLHQLLEIRNRSLFLPHIQRSFVWKEEQMIGLLDSLLQGHPIQTFLFWKTRDGIRARRFMETVEPGSDVPLHTLYDERASEKSERGEPKIYVLDGQQRLQTLFVLFDGAIGDDPRREAWLDLYSGGTRGDDGLQFRIKFSAEQPGGSWFRIPSLYTTYARQDSDDIADRIIEQLAATNADARQVRRNINKLQGILRSTDHFWYEELDGTAGDLTYARVLDIFVRVNSGGTKLDRMDLMFATMKGLSSEVEEQVEEIAELLNHGDLCFTKDWVLKCLLIVNRDSAEVGPELFEGPAGQALMARIEENWHRAEEAFQQLKDLLTHEMSLHSKRLIGSYSALVPLFDYLFHHPKPEPAARRQMVGYFYKAQLFNWYGKSTDQIINGLHRILVSDTSSGFPLEDIKTYFRAQGRDTEVRSWTLNQSRNRHIFLHLVYQEEFKATPFATAFAGNQPQVDHIYPKSLLRSRLYQSSTEINDLGNLRFVGATDNLRKRAQLPAQYFGELKAANVPVEKHLLVEPYASDPSKLTFDTDTFQAFTRARSARILEIVRRIVDPELP